MENKIEENKNINYKYLSLSPVSDPEYNYSSELLYQKICDKDIRNIGIVAPYGAGKSSLIATFKEKYNDKKINGNKIKCLNISLASFNIDEDDKENLSKENSSKKESIIGDIDNAVEKSILQQMLFKKEKQDLPQSKISRIRSNNISLVLKSIVMVFALLIAIISFIFFFQAMGGNYLIKDKLTYSLLTYGVFGVLGFICCVGVLVNMIQISTLKVKDIEVAFCNEKESLLNKFLDEVLYFFQKTKYNVVFIEDLDRFDNLSIFVKLRELNNILNENEKIYKKRKIVFVYAVKYQMFKTDEERTKFFDFIISLLPALSPVNARDKIKSGLLEVGLGENWLTDEYINDISIYFKDYRVLNSTINDCVQTINNVNISKINDNDVMNKHICLFSLMAYKNIHPNKYAELEKEKGELIDIINNLETKKDERSKDLKIELEKNIKEITALNNYYTINNNCILSIIKGVLFEFGTEGRTGSALSDKIDFSDQYKYVYARNSFGKDVYMRIVEINNRLDEPIDKKQKTLKSVLGKIQELQEKNRAIDKELEILSSYNIDYYKYNFDDSNKDLKCTDLLKALLVNGYIKEYYKDFMFKGEKQFLSQNDKLFEKIVIQNEEPKYDLRLTNPEIVVSDLSKDKFYRRSILNFDLINFLFVNDERPFANKLNIIKQAILKDDEQIEVFIIHYIQNKDWKKQFLSFLVNEKKTFVSIIALSPIKDSVKVDFYKYILKNFDKNEILKQNDINYMNELLKKDDDFLKNIAEYVNNFSILRVIGYKIADLSIYSNQELLNSILSNNIWEIKIDNIFYIAKKLYDVDSEIVLKKGISFVRSMDICKDYITSDINYYVGEIMLKSESFDLSKEDFEYLIRNKELNNDYKIAIIKKEEKTFDYFEVNDEILMCKLIEESRINIELQKLNTWASQHKTPECDFAVGTYLDKNYEKYIDGVKNYSRLFYIIANFAKEGNYTLLEKYGDSLKNVSWDIRNISNSASICYILDRYEKGVSNVELNHIKNRNIKEELIILVKKQITQLINTNQADALLYRYYLRYGDKLEIKKQIYKKDIKDLPLDFADASLFLIEIEKYEIEISDSIYDCLMRTMIDKKRLFISQCKFWTKDKIINKLQSIPGQNDLAAGKKVKKNDQDMDLYEALANKGLISNIKNKNIKLII